MMNSIQCKCSQNFLLVLKFQTLHSNDILLSVRRNRFVILGAFIVSLSLRWHLRRRCWYWNRWCRRKCWLLGHSRLCSLLLLLLLLEKLQQCSGIALLELLKEKLSLVALTCRCCSIGTAEQSSQALLKAWLATTKSVWSRRHGWNGWSSDQCRGGHTTTATACTHGALVIFVISNHLLELSHQIRLSLTFCAAVGKNGIAVILGALL